MDINLPLTMWTRHPALIHWIEGEIARCQPLRVHLCEGSRKEYDAIAREMVDAGVLVPLKKRPRSFWCRSHPDDVARVEESTFICSLRKEDAGPMNHWRDPLEMKQHLQRLFAGCMRGRTMYVVPYCMGPMGSPMARIGVEITDSPYVVLNMAIMTRVGREVLEALGETGEFIPGLHSVGVPLKEGEKGPTWPCNPEKRVIAHFPEERSIASFGSGYGGNALLGKKCFALRIASVLGRDQGWLAEHMLILGLTNPEGEKKYIAAAFPSACGKTNLAMLTPTLPGWRAECVGDDIAWMHIGSDGRLYAVNPEAGFFGVAPGTSMKSNPMAMRTIEHDAIFTNVALTPEGDVWWEGIGSEPPEGLISWLGEKWDPKKGPAAHPNARFTVSGKQCPMYDKEAENPEGVPISAILFGGRRKSVMPLVSESFSWSHGVFLGASLSSETTAAAKGEIGKLRHDPFAMLPFCGYHMGDYFAHWLEMGRRSTPDQLPRIYAVNWFRKGTDGQFLWPGFGENIRVLKWIFECSSEERVRSPIGFLPSHLDLSSLSINWEELCAVDPAAWFEEVEELKRFFTIFGDRFPKELQKELRELNDRLKNDR